MRLADVKHLININQSLNLTSESANAIRTITRSETSERRMLVIKAEDGEVTLENVTIDSNQTGPCVNLTSGDLTMKSGSTITNGTAGRGANVLLEGTAGTLTMENGSVISNGNNSNTSGDGGNVSIKDSTSEEDDTIKYELVMKTGSSILNGKATRNGGNIQIAKADIKMEGGTVSGGSAVNGGNIYIASKRTYIHISI